MCGELVESAAPPTVLANSSTPALTAVAPEKVLSPVTSNVPVPSLVMPPPPLRIPDSVVVVPEATV